MDILNFGCFKPSRIFHRGQLQAVFFTTFFVYFI